jgi:PKD repeat protein
VVIYGALDTENNGVSGLVRVGRLWFTVIGATGSSTTTRTVVRSLPNIGASDDFANRTRIAEATFTVGQFSSGQNQPPVARANGPYAATAGVTTQLSAIGSQDPDGRIVTWIWDFGDGTPAGSGETVQHNYRTAGTFTATLTVTDDKGATASDQARVTVTNSGTPNQPPVARISAPATGSPSSSITFSGTQSSDPDGLITTYSWNFGDGSTGTGPTVSHVYAAAGTYNVVLTVADNREATATAQHVLTITAPNPGTLPFTWSSTFGAVDPATKFVDLTVTLDLSTNIPETPGAEELGSYIVDSLKWDPVILKLEAFNFGPGQQQSIDQSDVSRGKVRFAGNTLPGQNTGVLTIARLRFRVLGGAGARVTTQTVIGPLIGAPITGSFNYRPKVDVKEGALVVP